MKMKKKRKVTYNVFCCHKVFTIPMNNNCFHTHDTKNECICMLIDIQRLFDVKTIISDLIFLKIRVRLK